MQLGMSYAENVEALGEADSGPTGSRCSSRNDGITGLSLPALS